MYGILALAAISCSITYVYGDQIKENNNDPIPDTVMVITNVYASPIDEIIIYDDIYVSLEGPVSSRDQRRVTQKTLFLVFHVYSDADT